MPVIRLTTAAILLGLTSGNALAFGTSYSIELDTGNAASFEQKSVRYACDVGEPFTVTYVNAAPNYLALTPIDDKTLLMRETMSASGVKYVADNWVWWTKGGDAQLFDLRDGADAQPVNKCYEVNDTP